MSVMNKRKLSVSAPMMVGNEKAYVLDCLESTWISSKGKYIDQFEASFADFCEAQFALSCSNGTVALHLALLSLGVKPGDEVIVPALTFIASANAVTYCGAKPIFVDIDPQTWTIDPAQLEEKITSKTVGIIVVHLYGLPCDLDPILSIARRRNLFVLEDAAEAHGSQYKDQRVGALADIGIFSFYGNKTITTGEGGMITTNDPGFAAKMRLLRDQGMDQQKRYWHDVIGYNYRMTNLQAAVGLAQLETIDWHLERRREVSMWYSELLSQISPVSWQADRPWAKPFCWMFTIVLDEKFDRDVIMSRLFAAGIETRPAFYPLHLLPPYRKDNENVVLPIAEHIGKQGLTLPTWAGLAQDDVQYIAENLIHALR